MKDIKSVRVDLRLSTRLVVSISLVISPEYCLGVSSPGRVKRWMANRQSSMQAKEVKRSEREVKGQLRLQERRTLLVSIKDNERRD